VYAYFRLGHHPFSNVDERLFAAISISPDLHDLKSYFHAAKPDIKPRDIFPFSDLSDNIDIEKFAHSFLQQPDLFIRVRPGKNENVEHNLKSANVPFEKCSPSCIRLPNSTKLDGLIKINTDAVVQDRSSQQTGELLLQAREQLGGGKLQVWDCCAASGGKAIMAYDLMGDIKLTVSDSRSSIIHNLNERFRQAGINHYDQFVADLALNQGALPGKKFDVIIADVPCSGSGTWARTPEQLYFFDKEKISYYSNLQTSILNSVMQFVKPGGMLIYLTCSVFRQENETIVERIGTAGMELLQSRLFAGYSDRADTLFGALFRNSAV
jgi:16S rRNA (cytosine967-C5)-methyltransferase